MAWFNNQGIPSASMNVPHDMLQYFSGTNPGAYGNWRNDNAINYGNTNQVSSMNALEQDLANVNYNTSQAEFDAGDDGTYEDTTKNMRLEGEPIIAENWTPKDIFDTSTTLTGYQKFPKGAQWTNKDKWLRENQNLEGITATNEAQKQGWFQNLMENTMLGKIAAMNNPLNRNAANYNPALQGQVEDLRNINFLGPTSEGYQLRGGPLAGQNLVSMFGTNDYDEMLQKKSDWFQKRKDAEKGFSQKNWDKVIAEQKARELENKARADAAAASDRAKIEAHTGRPMSDYRASRPASERQFTGHGTSGMGRSADRFAAQGGYMRRGYSRGGRVGILSVF